MGVSPGLFAYKWEVRNNKCELVVDFADKQGQFVSGSLSRLNYS